jgi:hypothetical protein
MKPKEDYERTYVGKYHQPTTCPGCGGKLTKVKKTGFKEIAYVCWNLGECRLAVDLSRGTSWEVVTQS